MKTVFFRAIEAPIDEKANVILGAVDRRSPLRFEVEATEFSVVTGSPFAYWASASLRNVFRVHPMLESNGLIVRVSNETGDDFRYIRLAWEPSSVSISAGWIPHAKGGAQSDHYDDLHLVVHWDGSRRTVRGYVGRPNRPDERLASSDLFLRPGLTYPRRTNGLSVRLLPRCATFSNKGPAVLHEGDDTVRLLSTSALANSAPFRALVRLQLARTELAQSYEVGLIRATPVPHLELSEQRTLARLVDQAWRSRRELDSFRETSHAFMGPMLLRIGGGTLAGRAESSLEMMRKLDAKLRSCACQIDDHAYRLYGISAEDRHRLEQGFGAPVDPESAGNDGIDDDFDSDLGEVDATSMVTELVSWSLGAAFGRFDVRLATGERHVPPEPEPFDSLPVCSPGMLTGDDGLPVAVPPSGYPLVFPADGILVDDPGYPRDLVRAVRSVFVTVFGDANARLHEAAELLGTPDLRTWFAREFFEPHVKRYSRSRRKAPIYWQLATSSGSYSVWIYIHRATGDTLFRVLNDFVGPKLDHEKAKLYGLTEEAGASPSAVQRHEIEQQEIFVGELQALKAEVARVAPLWKPNLDDGVILNFAPLWRLVPQSRNWQNECKKAWDKLAAGDYDWAHLAMRLWPERVVPKCMDDRSLAIAHGLEDVFWYEDDSGTWRKSRVDDATLQKHIDERTSATVKATLRDLLLSAATPMAGVGRKAKGRSASPRSAAPKAAPSAARGTAPGTAVDDAVLRAVKDAIASVADGASKADVLATTGLSDRDWNHAVAALLDRGDVTRTGKKRGTRYHVGAAGGDG